jgi:hypothetical protein
LIISVIKFIIILIFDGVVKNEKDKENIMGVLHLSFECISLVIKERKSISSLFCCK